MEGKKENKIHMIGRRLNTSAWLYLMGFLLLSPHISTAYAQSPSTNEAECISYAYSESLDHSFLIQSEKKAFGNNITIVHNCPYVEVFIDGNFSVYTESDNFKIPIMVGVHDIEIRSENHTNIMNNVTFFPDRLTWEFEYYEWAFGNDMTFEEYISMSAALAQTNWASFLTVVVIFALVIYVYWNLINAYVDRNYCEEVIK